MLAKDAERVKLNEERIKYWMDNGALPTDRVLRFLDAAGLAKREARSNPTRARPARRRRSAIAAAKQAEEDAAVKAKAAAEAPAAEPMPLPKSRQRPHPSHRGAGPDGGRAGRDAAKAPNRS